VTNSGVGARLQGVWGTSPDQGSTFGGRWGRVVAAAGALALIASTVTVGLSPAAQADSLNQQIARITAQVDDLQSQAETAAEAYQEAADEQRKLDRRLAAIEGRVKLSQRSMGSLQSSIDAIAVRAYTSGTMSPSLELLLANSANQLLDRSEMLAMVGARQGAQLQAVTSVRLNLERDRGQIAAVRVEHAKVVARMNQHRREMQAKFSAAARVLNSLEGKAKARYEAQQRARRAAQLAEARRAAKYFARTHAGKKSKFRLPRGVSPIAARALSYALNQIGKPYIAFAAGERAFDCSGLTTAAYRHAGISLPHYSKAQAKVTRHVSRSQLRPGDLVFFFRRGAHHVGIYIGNGKVVHALNPRVDVTITNISDSWEASHVSGGGRVG